MNTNNSKGVNACSDPQPPNLGGSSESLQYIDLYRECREMICRHSSDVMNAQREEAFGRFVSSGFPSRKVERYKYTDIAKLMAPNFGLNLNRLDIPVNPYDAFKCDVPNLSTSLYFIVNDVFCTKYQPSGRLPEGVIVGSLSEHADLVRDYYNRLASKDGDAITDLNTMLAQDGLLVYVPKGIKVERTIQVINILKAPSLSGRDGGGAFMLNRRVLILAEEWAEVTLLFCDHTADDCHFLTTQVIEVFARDNARVQLNCLEETHAKNVRLSNIYVDQQANSRVVHNVITLHNGITRNKLDLELNGEGAECQLGGCVIADKHQHVDNNTAIAPATSFINMCSTNMLPAPLPVRSMSLPGHRRPFRR